MFMALLPYMVLALNLILVLGVFYGLNRNVWKLAGRLAGCETKLASVSAAPMADRVDETQPQPARPARLHAASEGDAVPVSAAGLNSALRGRVLKMHRMGHSNDRIADTLHLPQAEIDLLVKVHRIVMRAYDRGPNPAGERAAG